MSAAAPRQRTGRRRVVVGSILCVAALVLVVPFSRFAVQRWNGRSAVPMGDYSALSAVLNRPRPDDATAEWCKLMERMPQSPTLDEPAPEGYRWDTSTTGGGLLDFDDLRCGPWTPADRPGLRRLIRAMDEPAMQVFLQELCALSDRPFVLDVVGSGSAANLPVHQPRGLTKLLAGASRYFREERGDQRKAWECLRAALEIAQQPERHCLLTVLVATSCEALAFSEMEHWLRDEPLDADVLSQMQAAVASTPDLASMWRSAIGGERCFVMHYVDMSYSRDANGGGWLVLADQPEMYTVFSGSPAPASRSRLWNLLSPIYHDRRTIEARVARMFELAESAVDLPYRRAVARLDGLNNVRLFSAADGPILGQPSADWQSPFSTRAYQSLRAAVARWEAMKILVALRRYRDEHHEYPAELRELVPDCIAALPADPFTDDGFRYARRDDGSFRLYSCAYNARDDGGERNWDDGLDDLDYSAPRDAPRTEPRLIPLSEVADPDAPDAP